MLNKIADLEKMVHRKIVHHDAFCYWLKIMYLFLLHPVYRKFISLIDDFWAAYCPQVNSYSYLNNPVECVEYTSMKIKISNT
jgi:hypothetical protein